MSLSSLLIRFSIVFILGSVAQAKVLVVSDIDDTIKISHVLNSIDKIENAFKTKVHFTGMPHLFAALGSQFKNEGVEFVYLSNAPSKLMQSQHEKFVRENRFPSGAVRLSPGWKTDPNHKITQLRSLLSREAYSLIILIGDNGERDVEIYNQATTEFKSQNIVTFIHQVYYSKNTDDDIGKAIAPGQFGFATAIDIGQTLENKGLLHKELASWLRVNVIPEILSQRLDLDAYGDGVSVAFPYWMDCRDFKINYPIPADILLSRYQEVIDVRCNMSAFE